MLSGKQEREMAKTKLSIEPKKVTGKNAEKRPRKVLRAIL